MNAARPRRPGLLPALLLAACLLAAQGLGALHRVAHGGFIALQAMAPTPASAAATHEPDGHQPGGAECLLIDHALAQADAWLPALLPAFVALRHPLPDTAAPVAIDAAAAFAYLARGPPAAGV